MKFARWIFRAAGIYGLIGLVPPLFMEAKLGSDYPPPITHPEYFYGFLGVGLAWQVAFLIMATDPARFRPLILPAVLEKFSFGIAAIFLHFQGRVPGLILALGAIDLVLGVLFIDAWRRLAWESPAAHNTAPP